MLSHLYRKGDPSKPPLRIGLLLDGYKMSRAFTQVVDDILGCDFARIELVILHRVDVEQPARRLLKRPLPLRLLQAFRDEKSRKRLMYSLYQTVEQRVAPKPDPLEAVDCLERLQTVESIWVAPIVKGFVHRFDEASIQAIKSKELDVLFRFGFNIIRGDILRAARYGIWSFHHGDNEFYRGGPSHFWELVEGNPLSGVILQVLNEELDNGVVLCKSLFATHEGPWVSQNRYGPYWGATHFAIRKLHELQTQGWESVKSRQVPAAPYQGKEKIYRAPTNGQVICWMGPVLIRKAIQRLFDKPVSKHWSMAVRRGQGLSPSVGAKPDMSGFRWTDPPFGHFYADPFLHSRNGKQWLLFEDYLYDEKRGLISCAEIGPDGRIGQVERCLERPYHLSYPCLFEHGGEIFMIPESFASGKIELYRARTFPHGWEKVKDLFELPAVDTTLLHRDGRWWFFTTACEPAGHAVHLLLFSADSLTGEWTLHPASPVASDVRTARNAGAIMEHGGRLYRLSQNCARDYGTSFAFNEIVRLNELEFLEQPVLEVLPDWCEGLIGTHTYNRCGDLEAVDGKRVVANRKIFAAPSR